MKLLYILLSMASLVGTIVSSAQFAMAIRYHEWGRVIVYFFLAVLCLELLVMAALRLYRCRRNPDDSEETL